MNSDVMPSVVQMDEEALKNLLTEVKETIATDVLADGNTTTFAAVDMWKIRRNAKNMRHFLSR